MATPERLPYRREDALAYARRWALSRNPKYLNFHNFGGDCTNFASQCLLAGAGVMNYAPDGWYYKSPTDRAPAWTSVVHFHRFLITNQGAGPAGEIAPPESLQPGDFIQLFNGVRYHHTLILLEREGDDWLVAAHSLDAYMRPLSSYTYQALRGLHITFVRQ